MRDVVARQGLALLLGVVIVSKFLDLASVPERLALIAGCVRVWKARRAGAAGMATLCVLDTGFDEPGFALLVLVHIVVVIAEKARAAFTLRTPASCSLKSIRSDSPWALSSAISPGSSSASSDNGGLQRGNRLDALGDLLLVVGGCYLRLDFSRFLLFLALLLRLVLRTLRGFMAAIGLTVHVSACLSSRKAGKDERCPHLYRYGHRRSVSQSR